MTVNRKIKQRGNGAGMWGGGEIGGATTVQMFLYNIISSQVSSKSRLPSPVPSYELIFLRSAK